MFCGFFFFFFGGGGWGGGGGGLGCTVGISWKMYAESLYVFMQNQMCMYVSDLYSVWKHNPFAVGARQ